MNLSTCRSKSKYTSCIKIDGRPILPPVINEELREEISKLKEAAIQIESQRKEKKRAALLEKVSQILERCTTPSSVETIELTKYRVINIPSLKAKVRDNLNTSLCFTNDDEKLKDVSRRTVSLPTSPVSEFPITEFRENFKNQTFKGNEQVSECSTISTDLGPYMAVSQTPDSSSNDSVSPDRTEPLNDCDDSTPVATSNSEEENEEVETVGSSTPVNTNRIRRLSYTLEAPSPVLLSLLAKSNPKTVANTNETEKSSQENEDKANGNVSRNGDNLIADFITQQQKMMQDLLERQQKEQQELEELFRRQEEELVKQLQLGSSNESSKPNSGTSKRNLSATFETLPIHGFQKLPALVKGYLTRRLLATDRVSTVVQTIRDTTQCLEELRHGNSTIVPGDLELHRRLVQQLNSAIETFHTIFFNTSVKEQMEIISQDRSKKIQQISNVPRQRSRSLSSATIKTLERKSGSRPGSSASVSTQRSRKSVSSVTSVTSSSNGTNAARKITWTSNGRKPWR